MSTFKGFIPEFDGICIDYFQSESESATTFFLSHIHSDHMRGFPSYQNKQQGLEENAFMQRLQKEADVYIYASEASTKMLKLWWPECEDRFRELTLGSTSIINVIGFDTKVAVTLLPAGHCPGAVMFLFEGEKRVLYTGDFRLDIRYFKECSKLYDNFGELKKIDRLCLDTTFFSECYEEFPTREQTKEAICDVIGDWINSSYNNVVNIKSSAVYSIEFLMQDIAKCFNMPVHVSQRVYDVLKFFPDFDNVVTREEDTQIYSFFSGGDRCLKYNYITILVSCMSWKNWKIGDPVYEENINGLYKYKVCNAMHSSYRELRDFINFIKADIVDPNVVPTNEYDAEKMYELIKKCMDTYKIKDSNDSDNSVESNEQKYVKLMLERRESEDEKDVMNGIDDTDYGDVMDSPPRSIYKKRKM